LIDDWQISNSPAIANSTADSAGSLSAATGAAVRAGPATAQQRWQPPEHGCMKCNVDVAFSRHRNKMGINICIHDEEGAFVLARTVSFFGAYPVDIGEALGLYHAL